MRDLEAMAEPRACPSTCHDNGSKNPTVRVFLKNSLLKAPPYRIRPVTVMEKHPEATGQLQDSQDHQKDRER